MKKKFPGVSNLAAGIAASFNPAFKVAASYAQAEEQRRARWKIMEEVIGYPINSESEYEKAALGAPREAVENPKISAYAWQLCSASHGRGAVDAIRLAEWYTERFKR